MMMILKRLGLHHHKTKEEVLELQPDPTAECLNAQPEEAREEVPGVQPDAKLREMAEARSFEFFDTFSDLPEMFGRSYFVLPTRGFGPFGLDEFVENGTLVLRVALAGVDPENDISITIENDKLRISASRRDEAKNEERDCVCEESHYGAFFRDLPLPAGTSADDVEANYQDGILEVRIPLPKPLPAASPRKIAIRNGES